VTKSGGDTRTLLLRDGRTLAYAQWGADDALPVLYLHGGLGSRLERHRDDETYRTLGVRLITVDRPGHGLSSAQKNRTPQDFAEDLDQLLDHLGLGEVATLGYSAGGLYALAFAHRFPARVRVAGIVSGIGIIDRPGGLDGLVPRFQRTYRNAREKPHVARIEMGINVSVFRYIPAVGFRQLSDRKVTSTPQFQRRFREALLEGARQGAGGFVEDIAVDVGPWGFDPEDVSIPVRWWHGTRDSASPLSHAQHVVERLPDAELTVIDGGGHFMLYTMPEDVLATLAQ
jgi:pimeloyl-ACP methyl ester carboxylesterase